MSFALADYSVNVDEEELDRQLEELLAEIDDTEFRTAWYLHE